MLFSKASYFGYVLIYTNHSRLAAWSTSVWPVLGAGGLNFELQSEVLVQLK